MNTQNFPNCLPGYRHEGSYDDPRTCYNCRRTLPAQGIEARSGETACRLDPKDESPVAESDAP